MLYNDEFRDTAVTASVTIKRGQTVVAAGSKAFDVPLGGHVEFPCEFEVPWAGGNVIEMVVRTEKAGIARFEETRRFAVAGESAPDRAVSRDVRFGERRFIGAAVE